VVHITDEITQHKSTKKEIGMCKQEINLLQLLHEMQCQSKRI